MTRFVLGLCVLTVFAMGAAAQEAPPSPSVDPQPTAAPPEASPPPEPSAPPQPTPPEANAPQQPSAPPAPSEDVETPTETPEADMDGESPSASDSVSDAGPAVDVQAAQADEPSEGAASAHDVVDDVVGPPSPPSLDAAYVCLIVQEEAFLECVSMDGSRRRFELAAFGESLTGQDPSVSANAMAGPLGVNPLQARQLWPFFLIVGIVGVSVGAWTAASIRSSKPSAVDAARAFLHSLERPQPTAAPTNPSSRLEQLVERTVAEPMDAEAQLELAAELFDRGEDEIALRTFERAVHLRPEVLLVFLAEPRYAAHRDRPAVRALLRSVWRDRERGLASYV